MEAVVSVQIIGEMVGVFEILEGMLKNFSLWLISVMLFEGGRFAKHIIQSSNFKASVFKGEYESAANIDLSMSHSNNIQVGVNLR